MNPDGYSAKELDAWIHEEERARQLVQLAEYFDSGKSVQLKDGYDISEVSLEPDMDITDSVLPHQSGGTANKRGLRAATMDRHGSHNMTDQRFNQNRELKWFKKGPQWAKKFFRSQPKERPEKDDQAAE
jgi:hypothetical protein